MKTRNTTSSGLGVMGVLQIIFIVLKLCKVITWKWWIVFIPLEIQLVISLQRRARINDNRRSCEEIQADTQKNRTCNRTGRHLKTMLFSKVEMNNEECDKNCVVHKLLTHNACIFCEAARNSPYHPEFKDMNDDELLKIQEEAEKECDEI